MRVIAGKYRGRNLKSPSSLQVRPTSDRLRETLFNVITPRIDGARFLDLCAGSGAVGIEALSRGAAHVTFVDQSRKMCALIEANLDLCKIPEIETEVIQADAADFLRRSLKQESQLWDIIFFDPPYATDYLTVLELLGFQAGLLLSNHGLVIVEHHHKKDLPDKIGMLERKRVLKQGDSALSFYEADLSKVVNAGAPKARNVIARGKRAARRPWIRWSNNLEPEGATFHRGSWCTFSAPNNM